MPEPHEAELQALRRENQFLKQRLATLEEDVTDLASEAGRLRERLERISAVREAAAPNPLGGGH